MIRLPVQVGDVEVQVNFVVVEAFSPYTAILSRPWLHTVSAVPSTLHLNVKYPTQGRVGKLVGDQAMTKQCLVKALIAISLAIIIGIADNNTLITPLTLMTHQTLFLVLGSLILQCNANKLVQMEHNSFVDHYITG